MAQFYSNQYEDAYVDKPSNKIAPGDQSGDIRFMFFDFTVPSSAPSNSDYYSLGKIPKGARVVEACLSFPDLGTAGVVELGWAASAEKDGPNGLTGTALELADADGFLASVDVNAAANTVKMSSDMNNAAGFLKHFSAEVEAQLFITTAWTATSGVVKGYISYVIV